MIVLGISKFVFVLWWLLLTMNGHSCFVTLSDRKFILEVIPSRISD